MVTGAGASSRRTIGLSLLSGIHLNPQLIQYIVSYYVFAILQHSMRSHRDGGLGSGLVDQSQKMTAAARAMAEKKTVGHLS